LGSPGIQKIELEKRTRQMKTTLALLLFIGISAQSAQAQQGQLDTTFNAGAVFSGAGSVVNVAIQPDNKYIAVGSFALFAGGKLYTSCIRLHPDGSADTSFHPENLPITTFRTVQVLADGKVLLAGLAGGVFRLHSNGKIDTTFRVRPSGNDITSPNVWVSQVLPDGKLYVGGSFDSINGQFVRRLVRLNADGSIDPSFNTGTGFTGGRVLSLAVQPDGKLLVAGDFSQFNGQNRLRLVRLHANGTLDTTFSIGMGASNTIESVALQPDGKVLIAGNFTNFNLTNVGRMARLNADGSLDASFSGLGTGFTNNNQFALLLQPDGKIIVGGSSTQFQGQPVPRLVRLMPDGALDTSFNAGGSGPNNAVRAMAYNPQGQLIIVGEFDTYNGLVANRIARIGAGGGSGSAVETPAAVAFKMYPNPATDRLWLQEVPEGAVVRLRDMQGRLLVQERWEPEQGSLSVAAWPAGLYLLEVEAAGRLGVQQLLLRR
jgi:uncharacterized delta-60 repeat protein